MSDHSNELLDDTCWVYVQQDEEGAYIIGITYDEYFFTEEKAAGRQPLLWRRFEDTLSADGYRIVLKELSGPALEKVLRKDD